MPLTTKDSILGIEDKNVKKVYVAPWKDYVYIRVISSRERDAFESAVLALGSNRLGAMNNFRARLACCGLCDEDGKPFLTERDAEELGKKSGLAMDIIADAIIELNAIGPGGTEAMAKNSPETQSSEDDSKSV